MKTLPYDRTSGVKYARRWAFSRNPAFFDFSAFGGDCTNFVSQCVYAGSKVMNYSPITGWYYISSYDRAPAWTGVEFFYDFFINNKDVGPFAVEVERKDIEPGDVIQLASTDVNLFNHTLFVTEVIPSLQPKILISAHTNDAFMRPLSTYRYKNIRYLHIEGVRTE